MAVFPFKMRVYYEETDRMGVAYYANYFIWYERARTELLLSNDFPYSRMEEQGFFLPLRDASCRYFLPVTYEDEIVVHTWISKHEGVRVQFRYAVRNEQNVLVATGETIHVLTGRDGKPCRPTKELKMFLLHVVEENKRVPEK